MKEEFGDREWNLILIINVIVLVFTVVYVAITW